MIIDKGKYYLYRHVRLDTGNPFYIGIGTKSKYKHRSFEREYSRAFSKYLKGNIWQKVVAKTEYEVEILLESDDYDFIKQKEIEFIKLYGRVNLKTGILSNLTDGGEGTKAFVWSKEMRLNKSLNTFHRGKFGKDSIVAVPVFRYDKKGVFIEKFDCIAEAARILNISPSSIGSNLKKKSRSCLDSQWFYEFKGLVTSEMDKGILNKKAVLMLNKETETILKEFPTTTKAAKFVNTDPGSIHKAANKSISNRKTCKGYKWRFKDDL